MLFEVLSVFSGCANLNIIYPFNVKLKYEEYDTDNWDPPTEIWQLGPNTIWENWNYWAKKATAQK